MAGLLIGEDPFPIEAHWQTMAHRNFARGGPIQNSAAAGIEMALWDIKGQALGVPVYELLGGKLRDRIWIYGRWDGVTPEVAAEFAQSQVATGLTALKGDPFNHRGLYTTYESEQKAIATLAAVRDAVGFDVELLVEAHGRLTPAEAIRIGDAIEPYRPFVFDEPVPFENMDAMQKVAESINVPDRYWRASLQPIRVRRSVAAADRGDDPAGRDPVRWHPPAPPHRSTR